MLLLIAYQHGVYLIPVHNALNLRHFNVWQHRLWLSCHDVGHGMVEEFRLPLLHGSPYVAVGYYSGDGLVIVESHAEPELSSRHLYYGFAKVHVLRYYWQVVCSHHVFRGGEKPLSQFAAGMELREVARLEKRPLGAIGTRNGFPELLERLFRQ